MRILGDAAKRRPHEVLKIMLTVIITCFCFSAAINLSGAPAPFKSFIQRFLQWTELLDPTNLVLSIVSIFLFSK